MKNSSPSSCRKSDAAERRLCPLLPDTASWANDNLAQQFRELSIFTKRPTFIDLAITRSQKAVRMSGAENPDLPDYYSNLGAMLLERYDRYTWFKGNATASFIEELVSRAQPRHTREDACNTGMTDGDLDLAGAIQAFETAIELVHGDRIRSDRFLENLKAAASRDDARGFISINNLSSRWPELTRRSSGKTGMAH